MTQEHPCIKKPENLDAPIWRYMDYDKFIDMLDRKALYFHRVNLQKDPLEGMPLELAVRELRSQFDDLPKYAEALKGVSGNVDKMVRGWGFINCWQMSEDELEWSWCTYIKTPYAVAIQTTFRKLWDNLPDRVCCGCVDYGDHRTSPSSCKNLFSRFFFKDLAFRDEKEIRAIILDFPGEKEDPEELDLETQPTITGELIRVRSLDDLIERVILYPNAPPQLKGWVTTAERTFGVHTPIEYSRLDRRNLSL